MTTNAKTRADVVRECIARTAARGFISANTLRERVQKELGPVPNFGEIVRGMVRAKTLQAVGRKTPDGGYAVKTTKEAQG